MKMATDSVANMLTALNTVFEVFFQAFQDKTKDDMIKISTILQAFKSDDMQSKIIDIIKVKTTKKIKDPDAPKRPKSGYLFFCEEKRSEYKKANLNASATELTSILGKAWKSLTDEEKMPFLNKAQEAKLGYKNAMDLYKRPSDQEIDQKKKNKKLKDPNAPKRPMTAFLFFCKDNRKDVKSEFPDLKPTEVTSKLGEMWSSLEEKKKKKFLSLADKAKNQYEDAKKKYNRPSDEELIKLNEKKPQRRTSKKTSKKGPKRPSTAFLFFCNDKREEVKNANPELTNQEVMKRLGEMWKNDFADEESRKKWVEQATLDKERYQEEMKEYRDSSDEGSIKTESKLKTREKSKFKHQTKPNSDSDSDSDSDSEVKVRTESKPKSKPKSKPESKLKSKPELEESDSSDSE